MHRVRRLALLLSIAACARTPAPQAVKAVADAPRPAPPASSAPEPVAPPASASADAPPDAPPAEVGSPTGDELRVAMRGSCSFAGVSFPSGTTFVHVAARPGAPQRALRWTRDGRLDATTSTWGDEVVGEWPTRAYVRFQDGHRKYVGRIAPTGVDLVEGFGKCAIDTSAQNSLDCNGASVGPLEITPWKDGGYLVTAPPFVRTVGGGPAPRVQLRSGQPTRAGEAVLATSAGEIVYAEEQVRTTGPKTELIGTWIEAWSEATGVRTLNVLDRVKLFAGPDGRVLLVRHKSSVASVVGSGATLKDEMVLPTSGKDLGALHFTSRGEAWATDGAHLFQRARGSSLWMDLKAPPDPARHAAEPAGVAEVSGEFWIRGSTEVVALRDGGWVARKMPAEVKGMHPQAIFANEGEVWIVFGDATTTVVVTNAQVKIPWSCDEATLDAATKMRNWTIAPASP